MDTCVCVCVYIYKKKFQSEQNVLTASLTITCFPTFEPGHLHGL